MISRVAGLGIVTFWIVMNALLWRFESRGQSGAKIPLATVTQRLLEAAESSTLVIRHHGEALGQLRWTPSVLEEPAAENAFLSEDGRVTHRSGYAIDFELNLVAGDPNLRGRGNGRCELQADQSWRRLDFRFFQRPWTYELTASADSGSVHFKVSEGTNVMTSQTLPLQNPTALAATLGGTLGSFGGWNPGFFAAASSLIPLLPSPERPPAATSASSTVSASTSPSGPGIGISPKLTPGLLSGFLKLDSRSDELRVARQLVRTYHVTARILDKYQADFWLGKGGEILRATFPGELEFSDQSLPLSHLH